MEIEKFDNFLPPNDFHALHDLMMGNTFPWNFSLGKSYYEEWKKDKTIFQFTHVFYERCNWISSYSSILDPILRVIQPACLFKIKANLTTITPTRVEYSFHRDTPRLLNSKTALFYVNTNNGSTIFNTGEIVESVANRLVIFDSNLLHTATSSTDETTRVVINFNYITYIT